MASEAARARRQANLMASIEAKLDALNGAPVATLEGDSAQPTNADLLAAVTALADAVASVSVKLDAVTALADAVASASGKLDEVKALVESKKAKA